MRTSAPLVRRAHNNTGAGSSSHHNGDVPAAGEAASAAGEWKTMTPLEEGSPQQILHHNKRMRSWRSAAINNSNTLFSSASSSWKPFFNKSKRKQATTMTSLTSKISAYNTGFYWVTLCIVFLTLNLISFGKMSTSSAFRRAHSSSTRNGSSSSSSSSSQFSMTFTNSLPLKNLRFNVQRPHSILLFNSSSGHYNETSTLYRQSSLLSTSLALPTRRVNTSFELSDQGPLYIQMLSSKKSKFQRSIKEEKEDPLNMALDDDMEDRIARFMTGWDDSSDAQRVPALGPKKKLSNALVKDDKQQECQRVSWHKTIYPNCNTFHEFDLRKVLLEESTAYVGGGSYREVYLVETEPDPVVIKIMGLDSYIGIRNVGEFLMDGVVGAAVTPHPSLVDMHGFCSLSMFSEVVWGGAIDDIVMPRGRCSKTAERMLNRTRTGEVQSMNNLTATQKLEWAYQMTQAVATLHQHSDGKIVHSDLALRQFLITDDWKQIKLTDFNQAQILRYDTVTNQSCDYISMHDYGSHRAPEVYMRKPVQQQIDIWGLGGCFYSLLTGLRTYHDVCGGRKDVPKKVIKGELSKIDVRWRNHTYAESVLVQAIEECSIFDPAKRITMEALLDLLGNAVEENRWRQEKEQQQQHTKVKVIKAPTIDAK